MKTEIKVPAMGESISEATVGEILKASGSTVAVDDEVLELETDKVNQVLYAPSAGVVTITVNIDDTVAVGQVIGFVDSNGEATTTSAPEAAKEEAASKKEVAAPAAKETAAEPTKSTEPAAKTPLTPTGTVRKGKSDFISGLSKPRELAAVSSGQAAIPVLRPARQPGERTESRKRMTKIRRVIAKRLVEAQQTTAMLTTFNEVDMTAIMDLRKQYQSAFVERHGIKLGFMSFFVRAAVSALQAWPDINSRIDGDEIVTREYYDVGIAVGTDRGLMVPVVRDCDIKGFAEIEGNIVAYAKAARDGKLSVDDLQGGGFTITNGGIYGSLLSTPILNPPQSGILGMHAIQDRPVAMNGEVVIRPMMYLALSYDHRIVDGKGAVSFLVHMKKLLENPGSFALEL
jgi:2-oxoglutarate dehydrogenase E2 component (dihydrolipoamide succinyltransferase)